MKIHKPHRLFLAVAAWAVVLAGPCNAAPPGLDDQAIAQLLALGWQIDTAENGSLLLYPPKGAVEETLAADPIPSARASFSIIDDETMKELRSHGWQVEVAPDQSVLLYPPGPAPEASEPPPPAVTSEIIAPVESEPAAPAAATPDDSPPAQSEPATEPESSEASIPPSDEGSEQFTEDALFEALEAHGWAVEKAQDGSLLLYPPGHEPGAADSTESLLPGTCGGFVPDVLTDGSVTLPVDTWDETYAIASAWVAATGRSDLDVGRVRHLFRVDIVSIVDAGPSNKLRHQIAVRRSDGQVVVLD